MIIFHHKVHSDFYIIFSIKLEYPDFLDYLYILYKFYIISFFVSYVYFIGFLAINFLKKLFHLYKQKTILLCDQIKS